MTREYFFCRIDLMYFNVQPAVGRFTEMKKRASYRHERTVCGRYAGCPPPGVLAGTTRTISLQSAGH